ncbi:hypothetical protein Pd630_LPD14024 (plasmid) [Rhodococcus opacus PD630]|nr:hypothetical protein Pd630_LPD14024 [Rhodococcus opacus PD630]
MCLTFQSRGVCGRESLLAVTGIVPVNALPPPRTEENA